MRVYVAAKTHDYLLVRKLYQLLRCHGHSITHDWTEAVELEGPDHENGTITQALASEYASRDLDAVVQAEAVIAIPHEKLCGTLLEVGAALAFRIPVLWYGQPHQRSVFWAHPCCHLVTSRHELVDALAERGILSLKPSIEGRVHA